MVAIFSKFLIVIVHYLHEYHFNSCMFLATTKNRNLSIVKHLILDSSLHFIKFCYQIWLIIHFEWSS